MPFRLNLCTNKRVSRFVNRMDCLGTENVCSVKKEDNLDFYRIHTVWMKDRFRINIASKNGAWSGEMTPENIENFSRNLQIDKEKYLRECKEALTTDDGKKGYSYIVENGSFNWKKMIDEDSGMRVKMGSVMLQPVNFIETLQNIIEVSLKYKKNLGQQVDTLLKNKQADTQRINVLQSKLEELIDKKNMIEEDLYSKFLLLLNSKKRKIQELEESIYGKKDKIRLKEGEENQKSDCHPNTQILHPYEMDTEDDDDDDDDDDEAPEIRKPGVNGTVKEPDKKKGMSSCKNKTSEETDTNVESGGSTISTHESECVDNFHVISQEVQEEITAKPSCSRTKNLNNVKKVLPSTKDDILDFFFS